MDQGFPGREQDQGTTDGDPALRTGSAHSAVCKVQALPGPMPADEGSPLSSAPTLKPLRMPEEGDIELKIKNYEISPSVGRVQRASCSTFSSLLMTRCPRRQVCIAAILPVHLRIRAMDLENVHIRVLGYSPREDIAGWRTWNCKPRVVWTTQESQHKGHPKKEKTSRFKCWHFQK